MPRRLLPILLLLITPLLHAEEGVVTLQHRPAEELAPLLTPLLEENERAVANGDQLILSATTERLHRLASIARTLDRPLRRLHLTLLRGNPPAAGTRRYHVGDDNEQRIAVTEGEQVELFEGQRRLEARSGFDGIYGRGIQLEERERGRRLSTRVWLVGEQAVVELKSREEENAIGHQVRQLTTRLSVAPGEWLQLRGPRRPPHTLSTTRSDTLWLRVEVDQP
ncbi:hypothetical protein [Endothiovibrio diazotrophicus]